MMTPDEYAADFKLSLLLADLGSERSQQTDDYALGVSDVGGCREYVRRMILREPFTDAPKRLPAQIGTCIDEGFKKRRAAHHPELQFDVELSVTLPNGYVVKGHPDEIGAAEVTDYKSKDDAGMALVRRQDSDLQNRFQRHLYYAAAHQAGLVPAEGTVRNLYVDRSGRNPEPYVEQEPYDPAVLVEAAEWLDDVAHAATAGEETTRDRPEPFCRNFCHFYTACRVGRWEQDPVPAELELIAAAHVDATRQVKEAELVREGAKDLLDGWTGRVGDFEVTSLEVPATEKRRGYYRTEVRRVAGMDDSRQVRADEPGGVAAV